MLIVTFGTVVKLDGLSNGNFGSTISVNSIRLNPVLGGHYAKYHLK